MRSDERGQDAARGAVHLAAALIDAADDLERYRIHADIAVAALETRWAANRRINPVQPAASQVSRPHREVALIDRRGVDAVELDHRNGRALQEEQVGIAADLKRGRAAAGQG